MSPFFSAVATTLQLQAPFTALMAVIVFRLWRTYQLRPMRDLAIGWSLWTGRMIAVSYSAALRAEGLPASNPQRRLVSALGVGLVLAALPYIVRGTIHLAKGKDDAPAPHRLSAAVATLFMLASLVSTTPGVPDAWRLGVVVFASSTSFTIAFGYVSWRLLRMPADELTTGRQLAAFGFGSYALKQVYNVQAFLSTGTPDVAASVIAENIVLIIVAMGSIALLFDRLRQREVRAEREQRRLEAELAAREHLESLGRLAGGVAHDFNNMLTSILCSAQLARQDLSAHHAATKELDSIENTATRASALTKQLLTFARREQVSPVAFDVVQQLATVRRYIERQLTDGVSFELVLPDTPMIVVADPSRFDQAIINLVLNARDALLDGTGSIRVTARRAEKTTDGTAAIMISVEDDGAGMDAATQARIFEPFFTTKGRERGTGLGLSIVHGAVSQAGGTIRVSSQPGCGTRFEILLPLQDADLLPVVSLTAEFPVQEAAQQHVLIVDDDAQVRRVAVRLMERRGFKVTEAEGASAAIAEQAEHAQGPRPVDLLLTDIVMPEMNGRSLARVLRERDPRLAVVYMSGYDESASETPKDSDTPFVSKPFNEIQLMLGVREALSRRVA